MIKSTFHDNGLMAEQACYNEHGQLNNNFGPAKQTWYENGIIESAEYWVNGELHNINGPARCAWSKDEQVEYVSYHINGKYLTEDEFLRQKNSLDNTVDVEWHEVSKPKKIAYE